MTRPAVRPTPALRHRPWRHSSDTAFLLPTRPVCDPEEVHAALSDARSDGFIHAISPALEPASAVVWEAAGFTHHERLCLLHHDLSCAQRPAPQTSELPARLRRATPLDRNRVLRIDEKAFTDPFWRLDPIALREALQATNRRWFRIDRARRGYAIAGLADGRAYLQRLAVDPAEQRRGIGAALTVAALEWARAHGADSMSVNTQEHNHAARALYSRLGFRVDPVGLVVLRWDAP